MKIAYTQQPTEKIKAVCVAENPRLKALHSCVRDAVREERYAKLKVLFVSLYMIVILAIGAYLFYISEFPKPSSSLHPLAIGVLLFSGLAFMMTCRIHEESSHAVEQSKTRLQEALQNLEAGVIMTSITLTTLEERKEEFVEEHAALLRHHGEHMKLFTAFLMNDDAQETEVLHLVSASAEDVKERLENLNVLSEYTLLLVQPGLHILDESGLTLKEVQLSS